MPKTSILVSCVAVCNQYRLFWFFVVCVVQAHVENLDSQVKEQEAYHNELQEVERWLLQMSSRMVTPDPSVSGSLEAATQQLARHKVANYSLSLFHAVVCHVFDT